MFTVMVAIIVNDIEAYCILHIDKHESSVHHHHNEDGHYNDNVEDEIIRESTLIIPFIKMKATGKA